MPAIVERDEENSSRKKRLAKFKRGPGVFVYDGSLFDTHFEPTPILSGGKEPVFDASGMPVADSSGRQVFQRKGSILQDETGKPLMGGVPKVVKNKVSTWVVRGVEFPAGKPVRVDDASLALKLRGMNGFAEVEGEAAEVSEAPKKRGRKPKAEGEAAEG